MDTLSNAIQREIDPATYLLSFLKNGVRPSGRLITDYRKVNAKVGSITDLNVYGSAQIQIGETIVTCGVNILIGTPSMDAPQKGDIVCDVTLSSLCDIKYDQKNKHSDAYLIEAAILDTIIGGRMVDLEQLCIVKGKHAYRLSLNIICLSNGGNLLDAMLLAAITALNDTKLPEAVVQKDSVAVNIDKMKPLEVTPITSAVPITVGVFKTGTAKDSPKAFLVDPSRDEEPLLSGLVTVVIDPADGTMRHMKQSMGCGLSWAETTNVIKLATAVAASNCLYLQR